METSWSFYIETHWFLIPTQIMLWKPLRQNLSHSGYFSTGNVEYADVVLPATFMPEKDGIHSIPSAGSNVAKACKGAWRGQRGLAYHLWARLKGSGRWRALILPKQPKLWMKSHRSPRAMPVYRHERLERGRTWIQWPCLTKNQKVLNSLHKGQFTWKACSMLQNTLHRKISLDEKPIRWFYDWTYFCRYYHTPARWLRELRAFRRLCWDPFLRNNFKTAEENWISEGQWVPGNIARGSGNRKSSLAQRNCETPCLCHSIMVTRGKNCLTGGKHDWIAKIPPFKVCKVFLEARKINVGSLHHGIGGVAFSYSGRKTMKSGKTAAILVGGKAPEWERIKTSVISGKALLQSIIDQLVALFDEIIIVGCRRMRLSVFMALQVYIWIFWYPSILVRNLYRLAFTASQTMFMSQLVICLIMIWLFIRHMMTLWKKTLKKGCVTRLKSGLSPSMPLSDLLLSAELSF